MSGRCYLQMWVAPEDQAKAEEIAGVAPEFEDDVTEDGAVRLVDCESNYGSHEDREALAKAGVLFYGDRLLWLSPYCFASWQGELHECVADAEGHPVVRINRDGSINPTMQRDAMLYWGALARVKAALAERERARPLLEEIAAHAAMLAQVVKSDQA